MRMQEQGLGAVVVKVVGVLLLGILGCTRTLERPTLHAKAAPVEQVATAPMAAPAPVEAAPVAAEPAEMPAEPLLRVHEIRLVEREARTALVVRLSRPVDGITHFALDAPNRVVVDIAGPIPDLVTNRSYAVSAHGVARVRVGAYEGKLRLVADVEGRMPDYEVARGEREIAVLLDESRAPIDEIVYLAPGVAPAIDQPVAVAAAAPPVAATAAAPIEVPAPAAAPEAAVAAATTTPETASTAPSAPEVELAADPTPDPEPLAAADATIGEDESYVMAAHASGKGARGKSKRGVSSVQGGSGEALPGTSREYTGQRISLDFKDADIQNVLRILADVSGLNIITTDDVQGKITMRLVEVPWDQALDAILKARGLDMVRDGNIIRVSTVEKLKDEREALRAANEAQAQAEPLHVRYIKVNYAKADEKFVKKIQEILTERGTATWDERTNTIVVRDIDSGIADAEELITHFDTQTPQILIEASIVEATENFARDLGVQWGYTYKASPETGNATGVNFPGRINAGGSGLGTGIGPVAAGGVPVARVPFIADFPASSVAPGLGSAFDVILGSLDGTKSLAARLTALERDGKGKVVSRPRVVTLNNQAAKIESLEILRVKLPSTGTVISTGAGGVAGSSQAATEQIKTGITLTVTPQLSSDGFVFLDVFAKSSSLVPITNSGTQSPDGIPNELSREAESHVLIKDGETFVLGGVFRNVLNDGDTGIPYLRAIPVLGWAFKNTNTLDNRQELLVFITPRSVRVRGSEDLASLPSAEDLWENRGNP